MEKQVLRVKREGSFSYPIEFEKGYHGLAEAMEAEGLAGRKVCIVTDSNVSGLYLEDARRALEEAGCQVTSFVFPAGEDHKNLDVVQSLYENLILQGMDRQGLLAALGGGVTGDLTGFAAATYLRGIGFIQLPTTLLAQVDSSVGGKTGVDFRQYKNMVGAFHQPRLVYMNLLTLASLSRDQFACGMGEVVKTGLICDPNLFAWLEEKQTAILERDPKLLAAMIRRCCEIKAGVVERDPLEKGERALLNLGHTIGHAVEKLKDFSLLHGQCVAIGLAACARISLNRGLVTEEEQKRILNLCRSFSLPVSVEGLDPEEVLLATRKDKKMERGKVKYILMKGIGSAFVDHTVTDEELLAGIREICA